MSPRRTVDPGLQEELKTFMKSVNSNYGDALTFLEGTSGRWPDEKVIRSGSLGLDVAIGVGGWPRGRIIELYGEYSSGKTTLALHSVREAQLAGLGVIYVDAENALEPNYARKLGVDLNSMLVCQPSSLEQAIDLMSVFMDTGNNIGLIVVDSVPALQPNAIMESSAEREPSMALAPRIWSRHLPKLSHTAAQKKTTIMMLNQVRSSMNPYGAPTTTTGGKAIGFYVSLRVNMKRHVEGKKNDDGMEYQACNLRVEKNKVGSPFKPAQFFLTQGDPIDWKYDVICQAVFHGVIQSDTQYDEWGGTVQKKGWYSLPLQDDDVERIYKDQPEFPEGFSKVHFTEDYIQAYQWKRLIDTFYELPSLLEVLEERTLNSLNQGTSGIDSENSSELNSMEREAERADQVDNGLEFKESESQSSDESSGEEGY